MKPFLLLLFVLYFAINIYSQITFYISPVGDDTSAGTKEAPVQTLQRAQELVRAAKAGASGDIKVYMRGGVYFIDKTIVFGLEDGGEPGQIITWAAYPGEEPVLSSGLKLSGWKKSGNLRGLPPEARGKVYWHSSAITISQSGENLISHNQISSMPYSGITMTGYRIWRMHGYHKEDTDEVYSLREIGWYGLPASSRVDLWMRKSSRGVRWHEIGQPLTGTGEDITAARDSIYYWHALMSYFNMNHNRLNIVENNEIFDVLKVLADGNGIYIADTGPYNVLRNNFIHSSLHAHGAGIRTDAQQINAYIYGNIIWKFTGGISSSADCMVFNNIVASCPDPHPGEEARLAPFYYDYRSNTGDVFSNGLVMRNVIWHDGNYPPGLRLDIDRKEQGYNVVNYNFYYWKNHNPEMDALLNVLRELKKEEKGQTLNPMFVDPENGDFRLHPSSPLPGNGFVPIDQDKIGLTASFPKRFKK